MGALLLILVAGAVVIACVGALIAVAVLAIRSGRDKR